METVETAMQELFDRSAGKDFGYVVGDAFLILARALDEIIERLERIT